VKRCCGVSPHFSGSGILDRANASLIKVVMALTRSGRDWRSDGVNSFGGERDGVVMVKKLSRWKVWDVWLKDGEADGGFVGDGNIIESWPEGVELSVIKATTCLIRLDWSFRPCHDFLKNLVSVFGALLNYLFALLGDVQFSTRLQLKSSVSQHKFHHQPL
jgi:hypothetical protein